MKRCIKAHYVATFGDIPVGSLWADDSEFIVEESNFVDADKPVITKVGDKVKKPAAAAKFVKES